jgi:hypothetical protein
MDKPKKVYEAVEELRKDSAVLIEDIGEATAVIRGYIDKLKPYLWYFHLLYTQYKLTKPNLKAELTALNVLMKKNNVRPQTYEQKLMYAILTLKQTDSSTGALIKLTKMLKRNSVRFENELKKERLTYSELKWINTQLEKIYVMQEDGEGHAERLSNEYIELIKNVQEEFPKEYALYTSVDITIENPVEITID